MGSPRTPRTVRAGVRNHTKRLGSPPDASFETKKHSKKNIDKFKHEPEKLLRLIPLIMQQGLGGETGKGLFLCAQGSWSARTHI